MSTRRKPLRHVPVVSLGCNCRRARIAGLTTKLPKPRYPSAAPPRPSSSTSSSRERFFSSDDVSSSTAPSSSSTKTSRTVSGCRPDSRALPRSLGGGVAVVKTSDDPYLDFRNSILQMIIENEIYGRDGLYELLRCLLSLNSAYHRDVILRAFADVVDGFFP